LRPSLGGRRERRVVAAFHAGWRGTVERIVQRGVAIMQEEYRSSATDLVAAVGPSNRTMLLHGRRGGPVEFEKQFEYSKELFTRASDNAEARLNLWEANRRANSWMLEYRRSVSFLSECTACAHSPKRSLRYFSHRAEHGNAGRMLKRSGSGNLEGIVFGHSWHLQEAKCRWEAILANPSGCRGLPPISSVYLWCFNTDSRIQ